MVNAAEKEQDVDNKLRKAVIAIKEIADKIAAQNKLTDEEADIDLQKVQILKKIADRAIEISNLATSTFHEDNKVSPDEWHRFGVLLAEQISDIEKYNRNDELKPCLDSLKKIYENLTNDYEQAYESYLIDIAEHNEYLLKQKKPAPLKRSSSFQDSALFVAEGIHDIGKDIAHSVTPSARTKHILEKLSKHKMHIAAAAVGIIALGLTLAFPPAAGCAFIVAAAFAAGIADGGVGLTLASKEIAVGIGDDIKSFEEFKNFQKKIERLRDSRLGKTISQDKMIDTTDKTREIMHEFNLMALEESSRTIKDAINQVDTMSSREDINTKSREEAKQSVDLCHKLLSLSDEINSLNEDLIDLFDSELDSGPDRDPQLLTENRESIKKKFERAIVHLAEMKSQQATLSLPKDKKEQFNEAINSNLKQVVSMGKDYQAYLREKGEQKHKHAESIKGKIKKSKISRIITIAAVVIAVAALGLALACPFVGPPLIGIAAGIFIAQLAIGTVATGMAAYDLHHSNKQLKEHNKELENINDEIKSIDNDSKSLDSMNCSLAEIISHHDELPDNGGHCPIIGAGASLKHDEKKYKKEVSPPAARVERSSPQPTKDTKMRK